MTYIDFKITKWERIDVDDEIKDEVLEKVKSGEITDANDMWNFFDDDSFTYEELDDTSEPMSVADNGGFPTIEIHSDYNTLNDEIIWDNGRKD